MWYREKSILAYFPYLEKRNRVGLWDHVAVFVCVSVYHHLIYFWMPEPIFIKLGMYIMAPEAIPTA
jgi:hypothetical protein